MWPRLNNQNLMAFFGECCCCRRPARTRTDNDDFGFGGDGAFRNESVSLEIKIVESGELRLIRRTIWPMFGQRETELAKHWIIAVVILINAEPMPVISRIDDAAQPRDILNNVEFRSAQMRIEPALA